MRLKHISVQNRLKSQQLKRFIASSHKERKHFVLSAPTVCLLRFPLNSRMMQHESKHLKTGLHVQNQPLFLHSHQFKQLFCSLRCEIVSGWIILIRVQLKPGAVIPQRNQSLSGLNKGSVFLQPAADFLSCFTFQAGSFLL